MALGNKLLKPQVNCNHSNYVRKAVLDYIMYDLTNSIARTTRIGLLEERRKSNPKVMGSRHGVVGNIPCDRIMFPSVCELVTYFPSTCKYWLGLAPIG